MSAWQILIPVVSFLVALRAGIYFARFTMQIRVKNYRNPLLLIFCIIIGLALLATLLIAAFQVLRDAMIVLFPKVDWPAMDVQIGGLQLHLTDTFILIANGVQLAIWMICLPIIKGKPPRRLPHTGKIKNPRWITGLIIFLLVSIPGSLVLIYWISGGAFWTWWEDHTDLVYPYLASIGFIVMLARTKKTFESQKDITELGDRASLVLYLRSFYLDHMPFARVKIKEKEFGPLVEAAIQARVKVALPFESYFGFQVKQRLGELVSVQRPGARIPSQMTATLFLKDDQWEQEVTSLIADVKIILLQVGDTQYVKEELIKIMAAGAIGKMYIFTQPASAYSKGIPEKLFFWSAPSHDYKRFAGPELKDFLSAMGIQMDFVPGPGSVIGFSKDNQAMLLQTGCTLPSDYIAAVAAHHAAS